MSINLEDHLDADHLAVLEMLPGDLLDLSDLPAARTRFDEFIAHMPAAEIPDSVEIADHHTEAVDGHQVLVRVYRRRQRRDRSPGLYSLHGGGMILGDVGMDDAGCAAIASNLNVVVASVDYRRPSSPSAASTSSSTRTSPTPRRCSKPTCRASCTCTRARSTARTSWSPIPTSPSAGIATRSPHSTGH